MHLCFFILENSAINTEVITVKAVDPDTPNKRVLYSLHGNAFGLFSIDDDGNRFCLFLVSTVLN